MRFFITKILLIVISWQVSAIEIPRVTCELSENPVGIARKAPRLGWELKSERLGDKQTAYEILVSVNQESLMHGRGDMWSTGKVVSSISQFVTYGGEPPKPGIRYFWKVRVWDVKGKVSAWSSIACWEMAPAFGSDIKWIGAISRAQARLPSARKYHAPSFKNKEHADLWDAVDPLATRSILLRKSLDVRKPLKHATVYISGLGDYQLQINGIKVGQSEFAPQWSDYDKTVYYNTYHADSLLTNGNNVIGVTLGNGFYNVMGNRYRKLWVSFGPPTLFFQMKLEYEDGTHEVINSDESWKWYESPITFNCIFGGEDYDATLEQSGWNKPDFTDSSWKTVVVQEPPKGRLRPELTSPVKVMKQYTVKTARTVGKNVHVLDMGQNLSGYPTIKVMGKKGQSIKLVVGELLNNDGTVNQKRSGAPYFYEYTLKGEGLEEWHPHFSYYGYQYIQIEGARYKMDSIGNTLPVILDVKSNFIYNSAGETGTFECSNDLFNKAHLLINNAVKSNWQSVFTDCPHREKLGWIEESYLNGPGLLSTYNLRQYVPKIMQDMADSQHSNGLVPNIAPEYVEFGGDFTDSPEWGIASVVLPWMYYEFYGDTSLIVKHYAMMTRYVDYLTSRADNYIVSHGLGDWYDYGEHAAGYSKNSPIALSATAHYYYGTMLTLKAARLLNRKGDANKYAKLANDIRVAYNTKFFNRETRQYGTSSQYSNAVSLFLELVPSEYKDDVLRNLIADIRNKGNRLTTGDVGNRYLYQVLAQTGNNDIMYEMHNHNDPPGYGFQVKLGLTTLTEQWDPRKGNSWNHFMMGQIDEWFYGTLAGIKPDSLRPGFKHVNIHPHPVGDLRYATSTVNSLYGDIMVHWTKSENEFVIQVDVPVNTTASVLLPGECGNRIIVNELPVKKMKYAKLGEVNAQQEIRIGSGKYRIRCELIK